jgi:hypothetical protein
MTFLLNGSRSIAQECEDVIVHEAFKDEPKKYLGAATCYLRPVTSDLIREYFYSLKNGYLHELIA